MNENHNIYDQLKMVLNYCAVFAFPRGVWIVCSIFVAKLLRRPFVNLPVPGTSRMVVLRRASGDIETYDEIFIQRAYDFSRWPHAARFNADAKIKIVDCGANMGCSVLWFAHAFPGAEIVAVEPDLANFELLNKNVAGLKNVPTIRAALWSGETHVVISNPDALPMSLRTEVAEGEDDPRPQIDTVTMDSLLAGNVPSAEIVKIDIEGAERKVFSENFAWLQKVDLLIIELHDWMLPSQGSGSNVKKIDYIPRGENLFCFSGVAQ